MVYRVLALDPGGTTGWSTYTAQRMSAPSETLGAPEVWEYYDEKWDCGQIGPDEHHQELFDFLGSMQTQEFVIVCESFEFRNQSGGSRDRDNIELISKEYIGIVKLFQRQRMVMPVSASGSQQLVMQTAGKAKGFIPDKGPQANKKIKDAGLWYPNSKHAMDATRHLLWYLVNRVGRMDLVERWWKP